ncbi:ionotropic receptor 75a-like [Zerene cesonia]|uniref:ionotropic receptor 75a-like n=1 Tax=Zerene cesonia TaxID=33412 RepID=UPI0018E57B4C|nr:ionotropic receptor 75a-like [Zerene cesonia]
MDILNVLNIMAIADFSVVTDILKFKSIQNSIIFHCYDENYILKVQKIFMEKKIRIANFYVANNITTVTPLNWVDGRSKIGIILDTGCVNWENSFNALKIPFKPPLTWILKANNISSATNILYKYPIEFDSDFNLITNADTCYKIYEIYNTGFYQQGSFIFNNVGQWDSKLYLSAKRDKLLTGINIRLTVVYPEPIVHETFEHFLNQRKKFQIDSVHKLKFCTLMMYLRDMYNFTYKLQRTTSWGYLRNGSFDGLVGVLQRKESDFGGSSVFFRRDRFEAVNYAVETWGARICFIFRHPKYPGGLYAIYTRPLASTVWYCTIALLLVIAAFLLALLKLNMLQIPGDEQDVSPSLAILFMFSALGQQGMTIHRRSATIQIIIFITFVFTLTLYQYYNAMIVSTLLRESPKTIRTLTDLFESNLKVGVEDVIYNKDYFKRTTNPVARALYHKKVVTRYENNFYQPLRGMGLVKAGGFAFHVDTIIAYPTMRWSFTESEICEVQEVYMIPPQKMGAILQKDSPYKEHVAVGIRKMFETGIMSRLKSLWDEPKPSCIRTPDTTAFSVNIHEFSMALIVLSVGMMLSIVILFCEILSFKATQRRVCKFRL